MEEFLSLGIQQQHLTVWKTICSLQDTLFSLISWECSEPPCEASRVGIISPNLKIEGKDAPEDEVIALGLPGWSTVRLGQGEKDF